MRLSTFRHARDTRPKAVELDGLEALAELLRSGPTHPDPSGTMPDSAWAAAKKRLPAVSPAIYAPDATRGNANVLALSGLFGDVDGATEAEIEAVRERLADLGLGYIEHESPGQVRCRHGEVRARIIVPFDAPIPAEQWTPSTWRALLAHVGLVASADPQAKDPSRLYFLPCRGQQVRVTHGSAFDWYSILERIAIQSESDPLPLESAVERQATGRAPIYWPGRYSNDIEARIARARAYVSRMPPAIEGQHGHDALWRAALVAVRGLELPGPAALSVLTEYSARCSPPWSERELLHKIRQAEHAITRPGFMLPEAS